jgi:hypothetical protein
LLSLLIRGRLVKDQKTKLPKLNCRNWECGVIVPVPLKSTAASQSKRGSEVEGEGENENEKGSQTTVKEKEMDIESAVTKTVKQREISDIFQGVVPVPMIFPGEVYGTRHPWFFTM